MFNMFQPILSYIFTVFLLFKPSNHFFCFIVKRFTIIQMNSGYNFFPYLLILTLFEFGEKTEYLSCSFTFISPANF